MDRPRNDRIDPDRERERDRDDRDRERDRYQHARGRDPDPERHIEEARRSLLEHVGELGRRFKAARTKLDVSAHISAHPLAAAGAAFALGALVGLGGRGRRGPGREREPGRGYRMEGEPARGGLMFAGLGALAIRLVKEIAMREASDAALRWWDSRRSGGVPEVRLPDEEPRYRDYEH